MTRATVRVAEWRHARQSADAGSADPEAAGQRRAVKGWTAALVLLCLGTLGLEFRHIGRSMPYPVQTDETYVAGPAKRIVQTGNLHPYTFNYPSLPKYLAAAGMAAGFIRGAAHLEIREVRQIGSVTFPYYDAPGVMQTARQLFALLSVIAVAMTGLSAWLAFRKPAAILLAPLILVATPLFFERSWTSLNVDIVGTCFVMLTIATCLRGTRRPSMLQSAIVPGALAGLATGSKYTLAIVILPVLLGITFHFTGGRRVRAWSAALAAMIAAFIAAVPYSVIDIPTFLNGVASEAFHYASGHRGANAEPGLPQLLYYLRHLASEFGVVGALLAVGGVVVATAADWRRAAILAIFPAGLLWMLASQRVHFVRNVLSLQPLIAIFAAFGLIALYGFVLRLAARRGWVQQPIAWRTRVLAGLILAIAAIPVWHVAGHLRDRTDSRNLASVWIEERVPPEWTIVLPKQLNFDARGLKKAGRNVVVVDLQSARNTDGLNAAIGGVPSPAVILVPRWGADVRFPGQNLADELNSLGNRWRALRTFGTESVLVNYSSSTHRGNPAFSVAVLK